MMEQARRYRHEMTVDDITSLDALRRYFSENTGFVRAKWSGNPASEDMLKEFGATIRCIPYEQSGTAGRCVLTGESATIGRDIREGILRARGIATNAHTPPAS